MDEISYEILKEMLVEDYNDFIEVELYSIEQSIAALLEDSVIMMKESNNNYISVIVVLAKISLENGIIPNYILERFVDISDSLIKLYRFKENPEFLNDKVYIDDKIKKKDFEIINDKYKQRVNMLLDNK